MIWSAERKNFSIHWILSTGSMFPRLSCMHAPCVNSASIGALGFWLERERDFLNVPDSAIEHLRRLAPSQARYAIGAKPGIGK